MKNRHASCKECYPLGNDFVTTIARVVPSRTKRLLGVIGRVKYAAVILCRRLVLDAILKDLLHHLWRVGLLATSLIRWEAYLLWLSHDPVSPVWGYSIHSQIIGKLGYCKFASNEMVAQESNKASSRMMQLKCLHNTTVTSCWLLHAIRTRFILDRTTRAVVETTVIDKHTSGAPILHTEASFTSAERWLHRGTLSPTSLKHCIWFSVRLQI